MSRNATDEKGDEEEETEGTTDSKLASKGSTVDIIVPSDSPLDKVDNLVVLEIQNTALAVLRPEAVTSTQTSHYVVNTKSKTVLPLPLISPQTLVEQNIIESYIEDEDKKRNNTESEIERFRKITDTQNHPGRLTEYMPRSLGQENGSQTQDGRSMAQKDNSNGQQSRSNSQEKRSGRQELQTQEENSTKRRVTLSGKILSEHKEALKGQEQKKELLNPKKKGKDSNYYHNMSKCQVEKYNDICIADNSNCSDTSSLKQWNFEDNQQLSGQRKTAKKKLNTIENSEKGKPVWKDPLMTSSSDSLPLTKSQQDRIPSKEEQDELRATKKYSYNTEKYTPDVCGSAVGNIYQKQISTDSDTDECEFTNDLSGGDYKSYDLTSMSFTDRSDNILPIEISSSELSGKKRNGVLVDTEMNTEHTYENAGDCYNSKNHKNDNNADDDGEEETENTRNVITVDNLFNDYDQLFTRIKRSSVVDDRIDNKQLHISTERQSIETYKNDDASNNNEIILKSKGLQQQFPEDVDENILSKPLYQSQLMQRPNQPNCSGHIGELNQPESLYKANVGCINRELKLNSSPPLQRSHENMCDIQHQNIPSQSCSSYQPEHDYQDNILTRRYKDHQPHSANNLQQHHTCTIQEQVEVDSSLDDYSNDDHKTTGDSVSSLNTLAENLGFKVKDVHPDGNCMFSAIVDQLRISGNLDFTPQTLRSAAVSQLRNNPVSDDGTHMESFLHMESWETYLSRMVQEYVWGDHIALQACVAVTGYRIHVIKYPLVITKLEPATTEAEQFSILYLGHVSESHFISLRQKDWEKTWHIKAKVRKLQKDFPSIFKSLINKELMINRIKSNRLITDIKFLKATVRNIERKLEGQQKDEKSADMDEGCTASVNADPDKVEMTSQSLDVAGEKKLELPTDEEWEKLENSLSFNKEPNSGLTRDKFGIDDKSGVPVLHLSYLVRFYVKEDYMNWVYIPKDRSGVVTSKDVKYIGSVPEDLRYSFKHYQATSKNDCNCDKQNLHLKSVITESKSQVLTKETDDMQMTDLLSETELCNPGYTLLCPCDLSMWKKNLYYINEQKPVLRCRDFVFLRDVTSAFVCVAWPESTLEWISRYRPSGWPNKEHIEAIKMSECLIVPKPHPKSALPECEWQFIFPDAELILAKDCLSEKQRYCFRVFKVLVDSHLRNGLVRLSTTHLKTVMYYACEVVPTSCWSENMGGCVLYLLERLGICLLEKYLPNYFIKENNMIEHFNEEQISWTYEAVLTLRMFPIMSLIHFADHYGITADTVNFILADREVFKRDRDANRAIHDVFVPNLVRIATDLSIAKYGSSASILFQDAYNEMLEAPTISGYVQLENEIPTFERFMLEILNKQTDENLRNCLAYTFDTYCGTNFRCKNNIKS